MCLFRPFQAQFKSITLRPSATDSELIEMSGQGNEGDQGNKVQGQWDVVRTSFDTANQLRELIGIASQPNVQPQAILAAENLGLGLVVSPQRITDAITALGGNDSVRLESIKGAVGLRSGNLQRIMRQSTPLLQFFLVVTACKPFFIDSELGDLVFNMMAQTSVLKRFPVSPSQLTQLIQTFSGYSETIVPIPHLHQIAVSVSSECLDAGLYERMDPEALGELVIRTFEDFVDQSVTEMTLKGHIHAVHLATLFSWLLPEHTHITVRDKTIQGDPQMKLTIEITAEGNNSWELETFKLDGDPTSYIFDSPRDEIVDLYRLPLGQAKCYFDDHYCSDVEDAGKRRKAIHATGELARVLTGFFSEQGRLFLSKQCCKDQPQKCLTASVFRVMSDSGVALYSNSMSAYGWDPPSERDLDPMSQELQKRLTEIAPQLRKEDSPKAAWSRLNETCSEWVTKAIDSACEPTYIVDPAMYLALDAVVTSTVTTTKGTRYFSPMTAMDQEKTDDVVGRLLWQDGIDVCEFRQIAFTHLLPGLTSSHPQDLVVSYGGYTVGMEVLWEVSTQQRKALGIRYAPGEIVKDGTSLVRVREANFINAQISQPFVSARLFERGEYTPLVSETTAVDFETHSTIHGDQLTLKHYIKLVPQSRYFPVRTNSGGNSEKQKALWSSAIYVIAMATHVGRGSELAAIQEREMARRLHEEGLVMAWYTGIPLFSIKNDTKALLKTSGNETLRFFAASWGYDKYISPECCFSVIIRHNAPLLSCIRAAEEGKKAWVVIP